MATWQERATLYRTYPTTAILLMLWLTWLSLLVEWKRLCTFGIYTFYSHIFWKWWMQCLFDHSWLSGKTAGPLYYSSSPAASYIHCLTLHGIVLHWIFFPAYCFVALFSLPMLLIFSLLATISLKSESETVLCTGSWFIFSRSCHHDFPAVVDSYECHTWTSM